MARSVFGSKLWRNYERLSPRVLHLVLRSLVVLTNGLAFDSMVSSGQRSSSWKKTGDFAIITGVHIHIVHVLHTHTHTGKQSSTLAKRTPMLTNAESSSSLSPLAQASLG